MCRKSIAKLEIIRPRLEQSYNDAIQAEKLALDQAEQMKIEQIARKEETERLRLLKLEQEKLNISTTKSSPDLSLKSCTSTISSSAIPASVSGSYYSLPLAHVPTENFPKQKYSEDEANNTLRALQDRMGIHNADQNHHRESAENPVSISTPKFFSEGGAALRPVHVPQCLISKFLQLAARNTQNNLETCGVLAGKLQQNVFTITCLIIPKQVATSDTCAMINEEEIIIAQDSLDVMSLGWIHVQQKKFLVSSHLFFLDSSYAKMFS